jgi:hypothetical protein
MLYRLLYVSWEIKAFIAIYGKHMDIALLIMFIRELQFHYFVLKHADYAANYLNFK